MAWTTQETLEILVGTLCPQAICLHYEQCCGKSYIAAFFVFTFPTNNLFILTRNERYNINDELFEGTDIFLIHVENRLPEIYELDLLSKNNFIWLLFQFEIHIFGMK